MADGRYRLDSGSWVDFTLTAGEYEVPSVDANLVEVVPFGTLVSEAAVSSFTENGVDVNSTVYLVAPTTLGTDKKAALAFLSYKSSQDARAALVAWSNGNGHLRADSTASNTQIGLSVYVQDSNATVENPADEIHALGTRLHYLVSWWIDEVADTFEVRVYRKVGGTWTQTATESTAITTPATLDLGSIAPALFARPDGAHPFNGVIYANRLWASTSAAPIADITSATVRDYFVDGDAVEDPATATGVLGTAIWDFTGPASEYTAGTHDGSMAAFTKTGAGSFSDEV